MHDTPPAPTRSPSVGSCCPSKPSKPGMCRIFVSKANINRNRLPGSPGGLPAIVVEHEGQVYQAIRVEAAGPVVFVQAEDPSQQPNVWAETAWPVEVVHAA